MTVLFLGFFGVVLAIGAALAVGARRSAARGRMLRFRLDQARLAVEPAAVDLSRLDELPRPVGRFLRAVLPDGGRVVEAARIRHSGTFNLGEESERWVPFTSDQLVVMRRPGFDWSARMSIFPGLVVDVHDAYVAGEGVLHASIFGLLTVAESCGSGEIAAGELMRFLAESTWYPTVLLPGQGVRWEPVDDRAARATLVDGEVSATLLFSFGEAGLVDSVSADARGRSVGGEIVPTPWRGRFWNYRQRGGMLVPLEGEVAWLVSGTERPYWRGRISEVDYDAFR